MLLIRERVFLAALALVWDLSPNFPVQNCAGPMDLPGRPWATQGTFFHRQLAEAMHFSKSSPLQGPDINR